MEIRVLSSLDQIPSVFWYSEDPQNPRSPLMQRPFFQALAASGSAGPGMGYQENHFLLSEGGQPRALALAWLRDRSDGDFSWDWEFAGYSRAQGVPWYPKLVLGVPASPFPRYQILVPLGTPREHRETWSRELLEALGAWAEARKMGALQVLFPHPDLAEILESLGWGPRPFQRLGFRPPPGVQSFEAYLELLNKNQRRNIRRERQALQGLEFRAVEPRNLSQSEAQNLARRVYELYQGHNDKFGPWGAQFLNQEFFEAYFQDPENHGLVFLALNQGEILGMSFLLWHQGALHGRYWGAREDIPNLHFELCFYRPLEWALPKGLVYFDPGVGGDHKTQRGFAAEEDYWYLHHPQWGPLLAQQNRRIRRQLQDQNRLVNLHLPFKNHRMDDPKPLNKD